MALVAGFLAARPAFAHERHYVWSQEYQTIPQGEFEFEGHSTLKVPNGGESNSHTWEYQGELEYGLTDHLTIAHYERWETQNKASVEDDSTKYKGFKFEAKYRIGEKDKYWVDPLLYLEMAYDPREDDHPLSLEPKLVLSKDWGKLNLTYNQILESELGDGGRTEQAFSAGMNVELPYGFYPGVEFTGQYWNPGSHRNELALGPTLAYSNTYFWVTAGVRFGVNHESNDVDARIIFGVPFG